MELAATARISAPLEWARLQLRLGEALLAQAHACRHDWAVVLEDLHPRARGAFDAALEEGEKLEAAERAAARMHLARLLVDWRRAIELCHKAIDEISSEDAPELWGTAQRHLADALLASERGAEYGPPLPARGAEHVARFESAVQASRAAVSAISAPAAVAEANVTLMRALTALGKHGGGVALIDEAITVGRAMTAQPWPAASAEGLAAARAALGNALLARARGSKAETAYHNEAVLAHRAALAVAYNQTGSFRQHSYAALGTALVLLAESRSETVAGRLAEDLKRVEANGGADDRWSWAVDVLAVGDVLQDNASVMDLLAALKSFADRQRETQLWEAWAAGVQRNTFRLKAQARRHRVLEELKACVDAHGTADMRLAWATAAAPAYDEPRPLSRQREVLAEIRAVADTHGERLLRAAWANGASTYLEHLLPKDLSAASHVLDELKAYAAEFDDPRLWSVWGGAICKRLKYNTYGEANLDRARAELAEVKPYVLSSLYGWPEAAGTIHHILLAKDPTAAESLRAEIKAHAEMTQEDSAWRAWMTATVKTIKAIRGLDYAAARALVAELQTGACGTNAYDRKYALGQARALIQDREVMQAAGIIDEVLKPLVVAPQSTGTGDNLRISRLDASKAPDLRMVGRGIHAREMILTGTAIEELPDDVEVTQRLDVSQCRRLKRLPANLRVGQLFARECTALQELPAGLEVSYLDLTGCTALKALPGDLIVRRGRLSLRGCERLRALPDGIGPIAQLDLSGCLNITALPPDLVVTAWIDIGGSGLTSLPPSLEGIAIRWRNVPVDERIAFRPETLNVHEILAETNAERRRVMMERFGLDRFMSEADAQVLNEDHDAGGQRRLLRIELPGDEPLVCVSVICPSTLRQFMLRVPPTMTTCRQAVAWTAGFDDPNDYRPGIET
jgi:hypothetical protein